MIEPGAKAPDFTLPDQDGNTVSLSDFEGQTVVLYFYPKADTPGCTTQACGVRDHLPDYEGLGAVIMGVSPDPVKAVKKFHDGQGLNFTLLADEDHTVTDDYGRTITVTFEDHLWDGLYRPQVKTVTVTGPATFPAFSGTETLPDESEVPVIIVKQSQMV